MHSDKTATIDEIEARLVDAIRLNPGARAPLVALARHLEIQGASEDSKRVYRGILPGSIKERHQLDPYPHSTSSNMETCHRLSWYSKETLPLTPPLNNDHKRNTVFHVAAVQTDYEYVDVMRNGSLLYDGKNKLYVDEHGTRNSEHSTMNSYLLTPRIQKTDEAQDLHGLSILLAAHNSHNFYHWHFDLIVALGLVQSAGIRLNQIDNILLDSHNTAFQIQTLLNAGITEEQITFVDRDNCQYRFEEILMVRLHNRQGMAQSHRHPDWLRSTFLPAAQVDPAFGSPTHIAVKRETRGFSDPKGTYALLEKNGYTCIEPEKLPYRQQIALFANASQIIAPHGAALSLLVYCKPGTAVHEFYSDHVQPCFWALSSALGLKYYNYNCSDIVDKETTLNNKNLSKRLSQSINVSEEQLTAALGF